MYHMTAENKVITYASLGLPPPVRFDNSRRSGLLMIRYILIILQNLHIYLFKAEHLSFSTLSLTIVRCIALGFVIQHTFGQRRRLAEVMIAG